MWQFYSNAQFGEDLLFIRVQGREVSFSTEVINQLLGTSQDEIFSFNEVQVVPLSEKALSAEDWLLHRFRCLDVSKNGLKAETRDPMASQLEEVLVILVREHQDILRADRCSCHKAVQWAA